MYQHFKAISVTFLLRGLQNKGGKLQQQINEVNTPYTKVPYGDFVLGKIK